MSLSLFKQGKAVPLNDKLTIRLITQNDLKDIITMLGNPNVAKYLFFAPAPVEMYEGFFNPIIENTQDAIKKGEWPESLTAIIHDLEGNYMGMAGLPGVMFTQGNFEVGYQLAENAWGQGIATLACAFMTQLAFNELDAHKVTADCYLSNVGSYKTMEKCGYTLEGTQKDYYKLESGFDDRVLYGITKAQFENLA
ncbi:GNAT family protein [Vibrio amylolyticus]|uniref:GNAT family N-acetyltransferase n=1 Tax=Vibrio TaxID=662 RepID=UPI000C83DEC5|nr:GNAT family protein [Vibrio sp. 10N.261.55.A7]PMK00716.1 GNAT family N-acetyltransferase [Vibrio sp. 10N.261.55.A7]